MEFYLLLIMVTAAIAALAGVLFLRTRHVGFPIGIGLLYYWSLYGAWWIVTDRLGGDSGKRYDYLLDKMFPVDLDEYYLVTLLSYAGFILIIEMMLLWMIDDRMTIQPQTPGPPIRISHPAIVIISVVTLAMSVFIMADQLTSATQLEMSAYIATRGGLGEYHPLFTIHQVLNRTTAYALTLGLSVYVAGSSGRLLWGQRSIAVGLSYAGALVCVFGYLAMLGNKNELFSSLILGGIFYVANTRKINWAAAIPLGVVAFLAIAAIDFLRGLPLLNLFDSKSWWEALAWAPEIRSSNEAFAPHFSLYGVLHFHTMLTYGSSFIALASSIVPRFLWPERPEGTYVQYAESLGIYEGPSGQGFTVHHATGWYLNFGLWGLVMGALLLGAVWALCFNAHIRAKSGDRRWRNVLAIIAPAGFVSFIPPLIRAGPEAYKGMVIEAFAIPTVIIVLASFRWKTVVRFVCGNRVALD